MQQLTVKISGPQASGKTTLYNKILELITSDGYETQPLATTLEEHELLTKDGHQIQVFCKQDTPSYTTKMDDPKLTFSVKLKNVMRQFRTIMEDNDIAGLVILHEPNYSEYMIKIDPSYSCARVDGAAVVLKTNMMKHYLGQRAKYEKVTGDTSNMFNLITQTAANVVVPLMDLSEELDKAVGAKQGKSTHTEHNETPKNEIN